MKIGILAFHSQLNCGGVLQDYAQMKFARGRYLGRLIDQTEACYEMVNTFSNYALKRY